MSARGSVWAGSRSSSATALVCCQPPNEKSTGTSAAPIVTTVAMPPGGGTSGAAATVDTGSACAGDMVSAATTRMVMADSLSTVSTLPVAAPMPTPSTLMSVRITISASAIARALSGAHPSSVAR